MIRFIYIEIKQNTMEYRIKTPTSSLKTIKHSLKKHVEKSIEEIDDKLHTNPEIKVYGKICHQHRNVGFFSDTSIGYRYSNQISRSIPLTPSLKIILEEINKKFNADYNGILVNKYKDGTDYISSHSDDESGLSDVGVCAISYGTPRNFRIRDKQTNKIVANIDTLDDEIIMMDGDFQKEFKHEIPIQKKIKEHRYSFTFRKHLE